MVQITLIVAAAPNLEVHTDMGAVPVRGFPFVSMEHLGEVFSIPEGPFRIGFLVFQPFASVVFPGFVSVFVGFLIFSVSLWTMDRAGEFRVESSILNYLLEHRGKVQGSWGEDAFLGFFQEVLSSHVYDVENLRWEHAVLAEDVLIYNLVFLYMGLAIGDLCNNKTIFTE